MADYERLAEALKALGYSLTKPRRLVFKTLRQEQLQTMQQLIEACPAIDRASVYRTVALFEQAGILRRLQIGWKYKLELTDEFSHHHHHLSCLRCGRIIAFAESPELATELTRIVSDHLFQMSDHQVEIRGLCRQCQLAGNN